VRRVLSKAAILVACALVSAPLHAWTGPLRRAISRDARRLVPKSLAQLLGDRESLVLDEAERFSPSLLQAVMVDMETGRLQPETIARLDSEVQAVSRLLAEQRVSEGLLRLGGLLRIPADLSDPVVTGGPDGLPALAVSGYYSFAEASLPKIPVVLQDKAALRLTRRDLPAYWQGLVESSRPQVAILRSELVRDGQVIDVRRLDFRSHTFGVASLSYSRAVTAVAATWLVAWRDARGDLTRMPLPREVTPAPTAEGQGASPPQSRNP
jgi:hypothetical protein